MRPDPQKNRRIPRLNPCGTGAEQQERTINPMDSSYDDRFVRFSMATESLAKTLQKYKNDCLEPFGLRSMHLMTLWCLWRNGGGLTAGELSRLCSVDKAFVSRVTGELGALGYVDRIDRGEERGTRSRILTLTERGREIMEKIDGILRYSVERITDGVGREQTEAFYGVLDRFRQNIQDLADRKNGPTDPNESGESAEPTESTDDETKAES